MAMKNWVKLTRICTATAAVIVAAMVIPAQGAVVLEAKETSGGDVEISGGGTLNLEAWSDPTNFDTGSRIVPLVGEIVSGPPGRFQLDIYREVENFSGPRSYGPGRLANPDLGTGDVFGLIPLTIGGNFLLVPSGYKSSQLLASSSLYEDATFDSLGMTPGKYTWSWGSGDTEDSFTLNIVPIPAAVWLLGGGLIGLLGLRRRLKKN